MAFKEKREMFIKVLNHETLLEEDMFKLSANPLFSFRTVYQRGSAAAPEACACSYIHEFFDYIRDDGSVDGDKLDVICASLEAGECGHVTLAHVDSVVVTYVTALQVALASRYAEVYSILERFEPDLRSSFGQVPTVNTFKITSFHTAVMKRNYSYVETCPSFIISNCLSMAMFGQQEELIYKKNDAGNILLVQDNKTLCHLCVDQNDVTMVKCLIKRKELGPLLMSITVYAIQQGNITLAKILLDIQLKKHKKKRFKLLAVKFTCYAILHNSVVLLDYLAKLDLLADIYPSEYKNSAEYVPRQLGFGIRLANWLGYVDCANRLEANSSCTTFLRNYGFQMLLTHKNPYTAVIHRAADNTDLCIRSLRILSEMGHAINATDESPLIEAIRFYYTSTTEFSLQVIQTLLDLGSDINTRNSCGETALSLVLSDKGEQWPIISPLDEIQLFKTLMFQNPDIKVTDAKGYTTFAYSIDCFVQAIGNTLSQRKSLLPASPFRYDSKPTPPTETATPMSIILWECGFCKITADDKTFPKPVEQLLHEVTSVPRPLKLQCRDRLRMQYPGRNLYYFLKTAQCPQVITDYILIKYLLNK